MRVAKPLWRAVLCAMGLIALAACSSDDEPFDPVADCQTRMILGTPNVELENFKAEARPVAERTEVYVTATFDRGRGQPVGVDSFRCIYGGPNFLGSDRKPPSAPSAPAPGTPAPGTKR